MLTLSTVPQPPPAAAPNMDMKDTVTPTALVTPTKGEQFYLCNPMDELIAARESDEPFIAHAIVGMKPKRIIIEPGTIARIQEV